MDIISPASALNKVDLPTLGLPTIATTGLLIHLSPSKFVMLRRVKDRFYQIRSAFLYNHKLCANLQGAGINITYEALLSRFPDSVITRAHYAAYLLESGYVKSRKEAFDRYLGDHTPYFVHREKITATRQAGGIPVLAHPTLYKLGKEQLDLLVSTLKEQGLMGIECLYSTYTPQEERHMNALAQAYDLLPSGGSDFHGDAKPGLDLGIGYGKLQIPESILDTLRKAK